MCAPYQLVLIFKESSEIAPVFLTLLLVGDATMADQMPFCGLTHRCSLLCTCVQRIHAMFQKP